MKEREKNHTSIYSNQPKSHAIFDFMKSYLPDLLVQTQWEDFEYLPTFLIGLSDVDSFQENYARCDVLAIIDNKELYKHYIITSKGANNSTKLTYNDAPLIQEACPETIYFEKILRLPEAHYDYVFRGFEPKFNNGKLKISSNWKSIDVMLYKHAKSKLELEQYKKQNWVVYPNQ